MLSKTRPANAVQRVLLAGLAATATSASLAVRLVRSGTTLVRVRIMTLTKFRIGILSSLVILGLAISLVRQRQSQNELREKNRALQEQLDKFAQLATDNAKNVRPAAPSFSEAQVSELLRLRSEVGSLRVQSNELSKLRAALFMGQNAQLGKPVSGATQMEAVPRESWANVGYATPEAAFQTICYAMSKGDLDAYMASISPEQQTNMMKELQIKSKADIAAGQIAEMEPVKDFQVVGKIEVGQDQVQMLVHTAGEDLNTIFIMTNVNGAWKFASMVKEN